jgi:plastocyanin
MNRGPVPTRRLAPVLLSLLMLLGCSGDSQVGSQDNLDFEESEGSRVGAIDRPSPTPTRTVARKPVATTKPPVRTTSPRATSRPTTARPAPSFTIKIVGTGQGFDPFNFAVSKGTRLKVLNTDNQPRTFTSDTGAFDSGMIAPGASYIYVASKPGAYNFHDETRPFAVGRMEVRG